MTKDEALDLALAALGLVDDDIEWQERSVTRKVVLKAITAIKQALAAPVQEPTATVTSESGNPDVTMSWWHEPALPVGTKLYTTPPAAQRTWVGLTDEEVFETHKQVDSMQYLTFGKAIEAKLKEKNT